MANVFLVSIVHQIKMMYVQVHELSNMELRAPISNNNGIRLLEDFQIVFKLKRLWNFFLQL